MVRAFPLTGCGCAVTLVRRLEISYHDILCRLVFPGYPRLPQAWPGRAKNLRCCQDAESQEYGRMFATGTIANKAGYERAAL
jgi:hypothetical protein